MGEKFFATPQGVKPAEQTTAVPALIVAGWDPKDNKYHVVNLGNLVEPLVLAEKEYVADKLDSRDGKDVTVDATTGAVVGAGITGSIEVPAGEVWYINRLAVTCPRGWWHWECIFQYPGIELY